MAHYVRVLVATAFIGCLLCSLSFGQTVSSVEQHQVVGELNQLNKYFRLARREFRKESDFNASVNQCMDFEKLEEKRNSLNSAIAEASKNSRNQDERIMLLQKAVVELRVSKEALVQDILLPRQKEWLDRLEFQSLLTKYHGDFVKVIEGHYQSSFRLKKKQQTSLQEHYESVKERKKEALKAYQQLLREIEAESQLRITEILTPEQNAIIKRLRGIKGPKQDQL